jgi:hypothetical protein
LGEVAIEKRGLERMLALVLGVWVSSIPWLPKLTNCQGEVLPQMKNGMAYYVPGTKYPDQNHTRPENEPQESPS